MNLSFLLRKFSALTLITLTALATTLWLAGCDSSSDSAPSSGKSTISGNVASYSDTVVLYLPDEPSHSWRQLLAQVAGLIVPDAHAEIEGVIVEVLGTDLKGTTTSDGLFIVSGVPAGDQTLVFSFDEKTASLVVKVTEDTTLELTDVAVNNGLVSVGKITTIPHNE